MYFFSLFSNKLSASDAQKDRPAGESSAIKEATNKVKSDSDSETEN